MIDLHRNGTPPQPLPFGCDLPPFDSAPPPSAPRPGKTSKAKGKRDTAGRFQTINAFLDVSMAGLTLAERSVWLILWRDTKPNGLAETSQMDLARRAGVSDRAVRSALGKLRQLGLVSVVRRGSLRRGRSIYRVHPVACERKDSGS